MPWLSNLKVEPPNLPHLTGFALFAPSTILFVSPSFKFLVFFAQSINSLVLLDCADVVEDEVAAERVGVRGQAEADEQRQERRPGGGAGLLGGSRRRRLRAAAAATAAPVVVGAPVIVVVQGRHGVDLPLLLFLLLLLMSLLGANCPVDAGRPVGFQVPLLFILLFRRFCLA